jgi:hypothetical protein
MLFLTIIITSLLRTFRSITSTPQQTSAVRARLYFTIREAYTLITRWTPVHLGRKYLAHRGLASHHIEAWHHIDAPPTRLDTGIAPAFGQLSRAVASYIHTNRRQYLWTASLYGQRMLGNSSTTAPRHCDEFLTIFGQNACCLRGNCAT